MKEELIRVLNNKLNDINSDIDSLIELNKKIDDEKENLSYVSNILALFDNNGEENILSFAKINREDFDKVLSIVSAETKDVFNTADCNYDGLVYLINGINDGVSLTLTDEQTNGIKFLIDQLGAKVNEYSAALDGYELVKTRYEINDIDELGKKKDHYTEIINNLKNEEYVCDTDLIMEAANYSNLSQDIIVEMLTYVLEYNTIVFKSKPVVEEKKEESVKEEEPIAFEEPSVENETDEVEIENDSIESNTNEVEIEDTSVENDTNDVKIEEPEEHVEEISQNVEDIKEDKKETEEDENVDEKYNSPLEPEIDDVFHFNDITNSEIQDLGDIELDNLKEENDEDVFNIPYTPIVEDNKEETLNDKDDNNYEEINITNYEDDKKDSQLSETTELKDNDNNEETNIEETKESIDNDFKDVIDIKEDYDEYKETEEKTSTREIQKLFEKYGLKEDNTLLNELVTGNINNYESILDLLKKHDILSRFEENPELLVSVLLDSDVNVIQNVLDIIEKDLSVDNEDCVITTKITINTIPSIFIKDGGNYHNFIENVNLFKELGLNLINLFDFSKELFVADNEKIHSNYEIVKKYGYEINIKNAKYMLLLHDIGDRLDYYVESVYKDQLKDETFDGAEYIKDYAAKLNVVTDETIKRIRYASENGKKVFGSKPKSLSGEITNLRVNALDISSDYLNKFFNNEFATLTGDEVREYTKLIHNSSNVGNYDDELEMLKPYIKGLRYEIDGVRVSVNKVARNYSILRSYGVDSNKALHFAVCYNLVITKDEYDSLKNKLDELGGNL